MGLTRCYINVYNCHLAKPPRITLQPQELKDAVPGKTVTFTVQTTGTEPLRYQWKLQQCATLCDVESFPGANSSTLTIASVQKSNEGSYCCTVSNCAGSVTSECATLSVGKNHFEKAVCVQTITAACCFGSLVADPPRITTHPREIKDAVPGNLVTFTIQATGTEPLNYQWEHKIGDGNDVERIPEANSSTLTIASVQKPNEGSYRCTVSNCAGSETSQCATLTVG